LPAIDGAAVEKLLVNYAFAAKLTRAYKIVVYLRCDVIGTEKSQDTAESTNYPVP
jgi:hypothetical protein